METRAAEADTRLHAHAPRIASRLTRSGTGALSMSMLGGEPKVVFGYAWGGSGLTTPEARCASLHAPFSRAHLSAIAKAHA